MTHPVVYLYNKLPVQDVVTLLHPAEPEDYEALTRALSGVIVTDDDLDDLRHDLDVFRALLSFWDRHVDQLIDVDVREVFMDFNHLRRCTWHVECFQNLFG